MNDFAAQFAFDDPAMREEIHKAQEGEGDEEGEESGKVGVHEWINTKCCISVRKLKIRIRTKRPIVCSSKPREFYLLQIKKA